MPSSMGFRPCVGDFVHAEANNHTVSDLPLSKASKVSGCVFLPVIRALELRTEKPLCISIGIRSLCTFCRPLAFVCNLHVHPIHLSTRTYLARDTRRGTLYLPRREYSTGSDRSLLINRFGHLESGRCRVIAYGNYGNYADWPRLAVLIRKQIKSSSAIPPHIYVYLIF